MSRSSQTRTQPPLTNDFHARVDDKRFGVKFVKEPEATGELSREKAL